MIRNTRAYDGGVRRNTRAYFIGGSLDLRCHIMTPEAEALPYVFKAYKPCDSIRISYDPAGPPKPVNLVAERYRLYTLPDPRGGGDIAVYVFEGEDVE